MSAKIPILIPDRLHEHAVRRLQHLFDVCPIERADAALLSADMPRRIRGMATMTRIDNALIDALPNLEIIANFGVGYDGIDADHAAAKGIMVTNTPDVLTEEVADTALGLLINTARELPQAETWLRAGRWEREGPYPLTRATLRGRRAGIYCMGRIGLAIARRLEGFGVSVSYHNRNKIAACPYTWYPSLKALAGAVDTLISVAPGGAATHKAINAEVLAALGADGILVSIGRGSAVDEEALIAALTNNTIHAAGLDVYAHEPHVPEALMKLSNTCLLPHVGSASVHTRQAMADLVVDNLDSWFSQGRALTPVPETAQVARTAR